MTFSPSSAAFGTGRAPGAGVTAVLGPTNTGKTHLAIERMSAHSSGLIGLPLRLLAREVYNRLVGRLFVATGLVMILLSFTGQLALVIGVMLVMILGSVVGGFIYSYRVWRDDPDRRPSVVDNA